MPQIIEPTSRRDARNTVNEVKTEEQRRGEFEAWARGKYDLRRTADDESRYYSLVTTHCAYEGWRGREELYNIGLK